jgi:hypothetical protein
MNTGARGNSEPGPLNTSRPVNNGQPNNTSTHAYTDRPPTSRPASSSVNPQLEQKHQQQIQQLQQKQDQEYQKLQQKQTQEQQASKGEQQPQVQQKQQQQLEQLEQKHDQQQQNLKQKQQAEHAKAYKEPAKAPKSEDKSHK